MARCGLKCGIVWPLAVAPVRSEVLEKAQLMDILKFIMAVNRLMPTFRLFESNCLCCLPNRVQCNCHLETAWLLNVLLNVCGEIH